MWVTRLFLAAILISTVSCFNTFRETMVHIDMKGSAPRPAYLKQIFTIISQLGGTGILMEWEDMFPFQGPLGRITNGAVYSVSDVEDVLLHAKALGLTVVPLVQTLGHAEWVLKTEEFQEFRERPDFPMVFCVGDYAVKALINEMTLQVAEIHNKYGMPYFHIGADEAFQVGVCTADRLVLNSTYGNSTKRLTLDHMRNVAETLKVLAWFDEFKTADPSIVKEYNLSDLIEPVVWKYTENLEKDLPSEMWRNLSSMFTRVWGASAFKGADGSNKMDNGMDKYITNNRQWFLQALQHRDKFTEFRGIFLTGWSRYDHFAALCETLPTSMASLAINIQIVQNYVITEAAALQMMKSLKCPGTTTVDMLMRNADKCYYPGYQVRSVIRESLALQNYYANATWMQNRERGWLQPTHIASNFTNPFYVDVLRSAFSKMQKKLDGIISKLRSSMDDIFFEETAIEFQIQNIDPFYAEIKTKLDAINRIDLQRTWRPRPIFTTTKPLGQS